MATEAAQAERAFQKQPTVFLASKAGSKKKRYTRNVGLNYKAPEAALKGSYIDKKCPFTGNVSIRGRILRGVVVSTKMKRSIVVRRDYLHYIRKYNRYEKRHSNIPAHCSPAFVIKEGDVVTIGECRPLSKTIRFNVLEVLPQRDIGGSAKKQFKQF